MKDAKTEMVQAMILTNSIKSKLAIMLAVVLSSCVNVAAPDKPIVINLNIKIEQEVLVKTADAVEEAIDENAGIF